MKASLAVDALTNAVAHRGCPSADASSTPTGAANSGREDSSTHCAQRPTVGSMGRVGACGDNAAMESFFALLQKNVLDRQRWTTREELRLAIVTWIERTYHRRRRQRRLGRAHPDRV